MKRFEDLIPELLKEAGKYETCMSLVVCKEGRSVELHLDTGANTYSEWIPGEGADIGLMKCFETEKVVGIRLPLLKENLAVHYDGPIRINEGFLKDETISRSQERRLACQKEEGYDEGRKEEVVEFRKAQKQLGMQTTLVELIDSCDGDEEYIKQLKTDLETTLENYKNRYKDEE